MSYDSTAGKAQTNENEGHPEVGGGVPESGEEVVCRAAAAERVQKSLPDQLMEEVVKRDNLNKAYKRVISNKGSGGVDGMVVEELYDWCREHGDKLREDLLSGTYRPSPVRGVEIPKAGGGRRQLGIPTVVDRMVQQATHQVLSPIFEKKFSESSYGFRPGRSAHDALERASEHVQAGHVYVADLDIEKYFDSVNHDILMSRVAREVKDKRILKLIRAFLNGGVMQSGVVQSRKAGTPQGGPLSPLLGNILLDDLDKELERRGHRFVRYADDCTVYVRTRKAGDRVLTSVSRYLEKRLKLRVNEEKSAVGHVSERDLLGHRLFQRRVPWDLAEEYYPF